MIRPAIQADRPALEALLGLYLEESGGDIVACPENVAACLEILDSYIDRQAAGAALVAEEGGRVVAFTLAGEFPCRFLTHHGRAAMGWGTFVLPDNRRRGLAGNLRDRLDQELRRQGFDVVLGGYAPSNVAAQASVEGIGFEVYQVLGAKRLRG